MSGAELKKTERFRKLQVFLIFGKCHLQKVSDAAGKLLQALDADVFLPVDAVHVFKVGGGAVEDSCRTDPVGT